MTEERNQELKAKVLEQDKVHQAIIDQYMKDHNIDTSGMDIIKLVDLEEKIITDWEISQGRRP